MTCIDNQIGMTMNNPEDMQNEIDELEHRCQSLEEKVERLEKAICTLVKKTATLTMIGSHEPNFNHLGRISLDDLTLEMVGKAVAETLKEHGDT